MKTLAVIWSELVGLFIDDEFLALAVIAVVVVAVVLSLLVHAWDMVVGIVLLAGTVGVLLASVYRGSKPR